MPKPLLTGSSNPIRLDKRTLLNKIIGDRIGYERFSPGALQQIADEYLPSLGLGKNVTFSAEAFANYMKDRAQDFKGFKEAKTPTGEVIHSKLLEESTDPKRKKAIEAIRSDLNEAVKPSATFSTAKTDYEESIGTFKSLLKEVPKKYRVVDLIGAMKEIVDTGKQKIQEQQKQEIELLNKKFQNSEFSKNLKPALRITDEQVEEIKKSLMDDLIASHKKQIDGYDKSTQESLNNLHQASANQMKEMLFIADLYRNDSKMTVAIENVALQNKAKLLQPEKDALAKQESALTAHQKTFERKESKLNKEQENLTKEQESLTKADPASMTAEVRAATQDAINKKLAELTRQKDALLTEQQALEEEKKAVLTAREALENIEINTTVSMSDSKAPISSVRLEQLQTIERDGGREIKRNEDGSYKLEMGMRITNPMYYLNDEEEKDLLTLAQIIRAEGSTSITMKITAENPGVAEKRARAAYEACIKSGFPPEKIKLEVNGKLLAHTAVEKDEKDGRAYKSIKDELFANKMQKFEMIQERSVKIREDLDQMTRTSKKPAKKTALAEIKKDITEFREAAKAKKAAEVTKEEAAPPIIPAH